jgi:hypothetical protein
MGMHGRWANPPSNWKQRAADYPITPQAIQIYRKMRRLERKGDLGSPEWWDLNRALNTELHEFAFPIYEAPEWERDYQPHQSAVDRFHKLEAASQAAPKRKYKFKWER